MSGPQFIGDFESGNTSQYNLVDTTSTGAITNPVVVTSPVRSNKSIYACGYQCNSVQHRCETAPQVPNSLCLREGMDRYFGWSLYVPSAGWATGAWQIAGQWHSNVNNGDAWDSASPPLTFVLGNSNFGADVTHWYIGGGSSNPANIPWWSYDLGAIAFDTWVDFVVHAKFTTVQANCVLRAWVNGVKLVDLSPPPYQLLYATTGDRYNYWKVGYYRDGTMTNTASLYWDNVRIGGTYASVDPSV